MFFRDVNSMVADKVRPIIGRVGGKQRQARNIGPMILQHDFSIYCEPFLGSAAIYFWLISNGIEKMIRAKGHHARFVLNDADESIMNLYKVCRDYPELLAWQVQCTPYSRAEHKAAQKRSGVDAVEEARETLVGGWQSYSTDENQWMMATQVQCNGGGVKDHTQSWSDVPNRILSAAEHLGQPQVEEARRALVANWQAFTKLERRNSKGDGNVPWGASMEGSEAEQWEKLSQRLLEAAEHLGEPDVEGARSLLVDGWQSFGKNPGNSWGIDRHVEPAGQNGGDASPTITWNTLSERLMSATHALKKVYLECDDAVKVIERWASPYTLIYADPPYIDCEHYYEHEWSSKDHDRLAECINSVECAGAIVSYYPDDRLDLLYPEEKWERHYFEAVASSAGVTRTSKTKTRPKRTELVLVKKVKRAESLNGQMTLFS
jgi:site-specific DNA-adenine methylase